MDVGDFVCPACGCEQLIEDSHFVDGVRYCSECTYVCNYCFEDKLCTEDDYRDKDSCYYCEDCVSSHPEIFTWENRYIQTEYICGNCYRVKKLSDTHLFVSNGIYWCFDCIKKNCERTPSYEKQKL